MPAKQLTTKPTEAELEAAIRQTISRVFPGLSDGEIRHQIKFAFTFGRATIKVNGASGYKNQARADIILFRGETPLAVLELKRPGNPLLADDETQGLSYARVLDPMAPLVIVTNGQDVRVLDSYTGKALDETSISAERFSAIVVAAAQAARGNVKDAIQTLMGTNPLVWRQAVEHVTDATIADLTATPDTPALPFVDGLLIGRTATDRVLNHLDKGDRLILVEGPPLIGKSNVLRDLAARTKTGAKFATLLVEASRVGIVRSLANVLAAKLDWPVTPEETRSWLMRLSGASDPALVLAIDGVNVRQTEILAEIEELTSPQFGNGLRLVVTVDDAVVQHLLVGNNGRTSSPTGRRAKRVTVDRLDDNEFLAVQKAFWAMRIGMLRGADSARELRFPWALRSMVRTIMQDPRHQDPNFWAVVPPMMGVRLIQEARRQFTDPDLVGREEADLGDLRV